MTDHCPYCGTHLGNCWPRLAPPESAEKFGMEWIFNIRGNRYWYESADGRFTIFVAWLPESGFSPVVLRDGLLHAEHTFREVAQAKRKADHIVAAERQYAGKAVAS